MRHRRSGQRPAGHRERCAKSLGVIFIGLAARVAPRTPPHVRPRSILGHSVRRRVPLPRSHLKPLLKSAHTPLSGACTNASNTFAKVSLVEIPLLNLSPRLPPACSVSRRPLPRVQD